MPYSFASSTGSKHGTVDSPMFNFPSSPPPRFTLKLVSPVASRFTRPGPSPTSPFTTQEHSIQMPQKLTAANAATHLDHGPSPTLPINGQGLQDHQVHQFQARVVNESQASSVASTPTPTQRSSRFGHSTPFRAPEYQPIADEELSSHPILEAQSPFVVPQSEFCPSPEPDFVTGPQPAGMSEGRWLFLEGSRKFNEKKAAAAKKAEMLLSRPSPRECMKKKSQASNNIGHDETINLSTTTAPMIRKASTASRFTRNAMSRDEYVSMDDETVPVSQKRTSSTASRFAQNMMSRDGSIPLSHKEIPNTNNASHTPASRFTRSNRIRYAKPSKLRDVHTQSSVAMPDVDNITQVVNGTYQNGISASVAREAGLQASKRRSTLLFAESHGRLEGVSIPHEEKDLYLAIKSLEIHNTTLKNEKAEMAAQIAALQKEASHAEFQRLSRNTLDIQTEKLHQAMLADLHHQIQDFKSENKDLKMKIENLKSDNKNLHLANEDLAIENSELHEERDDTLEFVNNLNAQAAQKKELEEAHLKIANLQTSCRNLKAELEASSQTANKQSSSLKLIEQGNTALASSGVNLQQLTDAQHIISTLDSSNLNLQTKLTEVQHDIATQSTSIRSLQKNLQESEKQSTQLHSTSLDLQNQLQEAQQRSVNLESAVSQLEAQLVQSQQQLEISEAHDHRVERYMAKLEAENDLLKSTGAGLEAKLQTDNLVNRTTPPPTYEDEPTGRPMQPPSQSCQQVIDKINRELAVRRDFLEKTTRAYNSHECASGNRRRLSLKGKMEEATRECEAKATQIYLLHDMLHAGI